MRENRVKELYDYPFFRLAELLEGIAPPADMEPVFLHIGEPQMAPPQLLGDTIAKNSHLWSKYPPVKGGTDYLQAISNWMDKRYGFSSGTVDPNKHALIVCGSREALYLAAELAVERKRPHLKGHTKAAICLPNPLYHVYYGGALMAGAEAICVSATLDNGFIPDFEGLSEEILARTAMIYLCTPGNPVGTVASKTQLQTMIKLARKYDFILAVDECYSEIYFEEPSTGGLEAAHDLDGCFDNVLVFNSLSKRSSAPGLRTGFVAGDEKLIADFAMLRSYGGAQVPGPLAAAGAALWRDENHVIANRAHYKKLVKIADETLGHLPGYIRPDAAFFLWLNVAKSGLSGVQATQKLWDEGGVKVQAGKFMSRAVEDDTNNDITPGDDYIRIALVYDEATMKDGLARISRILGGHS